MSYQDDPEYYIKISIFVILLGLVAFYNICHAQDSTRSSVNVSWDANTESDLSGYKVYYGQISRNYDNVFDVGNNTSYKITGLEEGKNYYFAVTAYDFSGNESAFSEEVDLAPRAPVNVQVKVVQ